MESKVVISKESKVVSLSHKELTDSGLLYELNRSIFHTINLELVIDGDNLAILDHRKNGVEFKKLDKSLARKGSLWMIKEQEKRYKKTGVIAQI